MVEDDREEGEMERDVESERRGCERDDGDTGKTMKHKGKHEPKGNQFFIKTTSLFCSYNFRFIGSTGKLRVNAAWKHLFRVG